MAGRDPQERAKSDDREAALDLIEKAHAEGRLGSADRTIRKNNVASASTLAELEMITRDLVGPSSAAAYVEEVGRVASAGDAGRATSTSEPIETPPTTPPTEPATWSTGQPQVELPPQAWMSRNVQVNRSGCGAPVLLGIVAMLVGIAITASVFLTRVGLPEIDLGEFDPDSDPTVEVDDQYAMDEDGMAWVVDRYRITFGTTVAWRAVFYPEYAIFDVPAEDGSASHASWIYRNGTFDDMGTAQANVAGDGAVNLRRLDLAAVERSLNRARRTLGVTDAEVTHAIVADDPFQEQPTVTVYVTNDLGQSAFLVTDLRGKLLRSFPNSS